jgi:sec-independent protein translocase protein TatA
MRLGPTELIIILIIVIILFGAGRIGKIAGELGSGIRAFREGLQAGDKKEEKEVSGEDATSKEE